MSTPSPLPIAPDLLPAVRDSCIEAGEIALALFRPGAKTAARTWSKSGGSPVTEADIGVDTFLRIRLSVLLPEAAWLSEETVDDALRLSRRFVWVVDPIDGTRAFMSGSPDWAVCVALLDEGVPILGVVHAPACHATYTALLRGGGAFSAMAWRSRHRRRRSLRTARIAGPKPMLDALARLEAFEPADKIPSLALQAGADRRWDDRCRADLARCARLGSRRRRPDPERGRRALTGGEGQPAIYNRETPVHGMLVASSASLAAPLLRPAAPARRTVAARSDDLPRAACPEARTTAARHSHLRRGWLIWCRPRHRLRRHGSRACLDF
jgi:myo-inositol-1(or 4)-monophosphatase